MKKYFSIILLCTLVFLAAACSAKQDSEPQEPAGPETAAAQQVDLDLQALKGSSTEDIAAVLGVSSILSDADSSKADAFAVKLMEFDYKVLGEEVSEDGQTAAVALQIKTYDFGSTCKSAIKKLAVKILSGSIDRNDRAAILDYLLPQLTKAKDKTFTAEVTVNCTLDGDVWQTDLAENEAFQQAILGGLVEALEQYL